MLLARRYTAQSPIQLHDIDEYESFVSGEFPNYLGRFTNLSFIGLFESKATKGENQLSVVCVKSENVNL